MGQIVKEGRHTDRPVRSWTKKVEIVQNEGKEDGREVKRNGAQTQVQGGKREQDWRAGVRYSLSSRKAGTSREPSSSCFIPNIFTQCWFSVCFVLS